jgi:hypothetical protein
MALARFFAFISGNNLRLCDFLFYKPPPGPQLAQAGIELVQTARPGNRCIVEEMLLIEPPPPSRMPGMQYFANQNRPGDRTNSDVDLAYSAVTSYLSLCNTIRGRWGTTKLDELEAFEFQTWLKGLKRSGKSKGLLNALMNRLFNRARLFRMVYFLESPIGLVEVRGIGKRRRNQWI